MKKIALALAIFLLSANVASAAALGGGPIIGVGEFIGVPGPIHYGVYPSIGGFLSIDLGKVVLMPSIVIEVAPETLHWGFVPSLTADFPVLKHLGLDINLMLMHDQPAGDWSKSEIYLGVGTGFSIYVGKWTLSPVVDILWDATHGGWNVFPGLSLSKTFP